MAQKGAITGSTFVVTIIAYVLLQRWAYDALSLANGQGLLGIALIIAAYSITVALATPQTKFGWLSMAAGTIVVASLAIVPICFLFSRPLLGVLIWAELAAKFVFLIPVWFALLVVASFKRERPSFLCASLFTLLTAGLATLPGIFITAHDAAA